VSVHVLIGADETNPAETHHDVVAILLLYGDGTLAERHLNTVNPRMLAYGLRRIATDLDRQGLAQGLPAYQP
jgi:hypothetical protein